MKFKKTVFFILGCIFAVSIFAQTVDVDIPNNTRLVDSKGNVSNDKGVFEESDFTYSSQLAKKDIIGFYQRYFNQQGFKEEIINTADRYKKNVFMFQKQAEQKYVKLIFLGEQEGVVRYELDVMEFKSAVRKNPGGCKGGNCGLQTDTKVDEYPFHQKNGNTIATLNFVEPKKVNFMPTLLDAKQIEYIEWKDAQPPMISAGYISRQDAVAVIDFYLQKMSSYGWDLADNQPHQGAYSVEEWIAMVAPYTSIRENYTKVFPEKIPLLKIHGATLTFTNSSQKCIVTVHTFDDAIQLAAQQTFYDIKFMEDYGTTVIGVVYFPEGE